MRHIRANGLALVIVLVSVAGYLPFAPVRMHDFRAFYCAGKAIVAHKDPYREHPLHECERDTTAPGVSVDADDVTVPAPLPGYALALFALLSLLPFGICAVLWIVASTAAVVVQIELLRRVFKLPVPMLTVAVFLPAAIVAIPLGQLAPFVGCGIAVCAYALTVGRWRLAAAGALATSLDPAIAIVICATLLIAVPATRATILCGTALLVALCVLTLGVAVNAEYLFTVLGMHAAGNIAERSQFSTTHFAWIAGAGTAAALMIGKLWYGCAAVTGIWIASRLRSKCGNAALAFVPAAFAVFGGLYVHFSQVVLAIPAYLMVLRACRHKQSLMAAGIYVLAVPWLALTAFPPFAVALVIMAIAYARGTRDQKLGVRMGIASAALLLVFFTLALISIHVPTVAFHGTVVENPLAETAWSRYVAWRDPAPNRLFILLQVPTIVASTACLTGLTWLAVQRRRPSTLAVP